MVLGRNGQVDFLSSIQITSQVSEIELKLFYLAPLFLCLI